MEYKTIKNIFVFIFFFTHHFDTENGAQLLSLNTFIQSLKKFLDWIKIYKMISNIQHRKKECKKSLTSNKKRIDHFFEWKTTENKKTWGIFFLRRKKKTKNVHTDPLVYHIKCAQIVIKKVLSFAQTIWMKKKKTRWKLKKV